MHIRHNVSFKLHVHGHINFYRRSHAACTVAGCVPRTGARHSSALGKTSFHPQCVCLWKRHPVFQWPQNLRRSFRVNSRTTEATSTSKTL